MGAVVALSGRLDDRQLALCEEIASLPVPQLPAADDRFFAQCMRALSILPSRPDDDTTGKLRLALYQRHFGNRSREALTYLTEQATLHCRFFPTPSECNAILNRWERADPEYRAVAHAGMLARIEHEARFEDLLTRFRAGSVEQPEVDALPDRWRRICRERGFLRADFTIRPLETGGRQ